MLMRGHPFIYVTVVDKRRCLLSSNRACLVATVGGRAANDKH